MASGDPTQPDRPILSGGEALRREAERASGGGPKYHPRTFEEAREQLSPQVDALRQAVADTPATLRGARVVFEATVLPNYLANSYFPTELFREADLVPVGTRATTGQYQTRTRVQDNQPTKSYLLAGDERSIARVSELLAADTARGAANAFASSMWSVCLMSKRSSDPGRRCPPRSCSPGRLSFIPPSTRLAR